MSKSWGEIRDEALRRCGQKPPQTNADRIRAMDIDHLIEWYCYHRDCGMCPYGGIECGIRKWLKQEATE